MVEVLPGILLSEEMEMEVEEERGGEVQVGEVLVEEEDLGEEVLVGDDLVGEVLGEVEGDEV